MEEPLASTAAAPAGLPPDDGVASANVEAFLIYLRKTVVLILGQGQNGGPIPSTVFEDKQSQDAARKFVCDPQTRVILVQRIQKKGEQSND